MIGASGGYSLPQEFVYSFKRITVYDPDPIAQYIFNHRFPKANLSWRTDDVFGIKAEDFQIFRRFLEQTRPIPILFCNVLGQLPVLLKNCSPDKIEQMMLDLSQILKQEIPMRPIASFHDRFSKTIKKGVDEVILRDHLTSTLFPNGDKLPEISWRISPTEEHIISLYKNE